MKPLLAAMTPLLLLAACIGPSAAKVVEGLRQEALAGDPRAQFELGLAYDIGSGVAEDDQQAALWYRMAADAGYATAQNSLGSMLLAGEGVEQNDELALTWFRQAAEQRHPNATNSVAFMYYMGRGVEQDNEEAARIFEQACDLGDVEAMYNLADMLARGEHGPQADPVEAYKWLDLARWLTGTSRNKRLKWRVRGALDRLAETLTAEQIDEGKKRAAAWSAAFNARR